MEWNHLKMMRDNEKKLLEIFSNLDSDYSDLLIIVEGRRDEKVLRDLGVESKILRTQVGQARNSLIETIMQTTGESGKVLILTDFDHEGNELQRFIEQELEVRKIKILRRLRKKIRKAMGNWRAIEEMVALFKRKDSPEPVSLS